MGTRHPDNIPITAAYPGWASVRRMADSGWVIISVCRSCDLKLNVNLGLVEKAHGPAYSLWNRTGRCPKVGCLTGVTDYFARPPRCSMFRRLVADEKAPCP